MGSGAIGNLSAERKNKQALLININNRKEPVVMTTKIKTGGVVPVSGQYRSGKSKTEVTFVKGKRIQPTLSGATTFTLVDKTKHRGGSR